jgi:hypothetical protein
MKHATQARIGSTLLEFIVALVVLGVAMSGMMPLLVVLSRDLQPLKKRDAGGVNYSYFTPSRDWCTNDNAQNYRHTWYLTAFDDPWARKLGASAQIVSASPSSSPAGLYPAVISVNDDNSGTSGTYANSGSWNYVITAPAAMGGDYHYHAVPQGTGAPPADKYALWTLSVATAGWYSVQATWPAGTGRNLTTVQYDVQSNGTSLSGSPFSVDQSDTTSGITDAAGQVWRKLTPAPVYLQPGAVTVRLQVPMAPSSGLDVLADGVRLAQNDVTVDSLQRPLNNQNVTANVSVTVNVPR